MKSGATRPSVHTVSALAGILAVVIGVGVLAGWAWDIAVLKSVVPGWVSVKPNTALAFVLLGTAVYVAARERMQDGGRTTDGGGRTLVVLAGRIAGLLAGVIGLLSLAEYAFHWNPGFDQWLFPEPSGTVGTSHPGRMAPDTAICFVLLAVGGELARVKHTGARELWAALVFGVLVAVIGSVEVASYLAPQVRAYGWGGLTMMALPTALLFMALGGALGGVAVAREKPAPGGSAEPFARSRDPVSFKFLLIFLGLAVGIVGAGMYYYRNYERNFRTEAEQQLAAIVDLKVSELTLWRKERLGDGAVLGENPAFTALARRVLASPPDAEAQRQLQIWLGLYQSRLGYGRVSLVDPQAVERVTSLGTLGPVCSHVTDNLAALLQAGQPALLDFHREKSSGPIHLSVLVPLFDSANGRQALGAVILWIDPSEYLYPLIQRWPGESKTAETLLVRREGNEVVFLNELRFRAHAALSLRVPLDNARMPAVWGALGREGSSEGVDYRGVPVLAAVRRIPDSPWSLVARRDLAEVLAPLQAQLWQVITLVGVLLFGAGTSTSLLWRQQRLRFYETRLKSAHALQQSEDLLNETGRIAKIGGWVIDLKSQDLRWTEAVYALHEVGPDFRPTVEAAINFYTPESRPIIQQAVQRSIQSGEPFNLELELITAKQRRLTVNAIGHVEREAGKAPRVVGVIQDITQRKQAEAALRESEKANRRLIQNLHAGVVVHAPDTQITLANEQASTLLGLSVEQLLGKTAVDPAWCFLRENEIPMPLEEFPVNRVVATRQPLRDLVVGVCRPRTRDQVWLLVNAFPEFDDREQLRQIVVTFVDITARKQAEAALQTEKMNLDAIFETSPVALFILDDRTNIVRVNTAAVALTGGDAAAALQHRPGNALRCVHAAKDPRGCGYGPGCPLCPARNGMEALLANGGALHGAELRLELMRNGAPEPVWLAIDAETVQLDGRRHLCVAMEDVTARRQAAAINAARLHLIEFAAEHSLDDLLEETLNEAEKLSGSVIGFYHFVEADQVTLTLQNWSTRTKAEFCRAEGKGMHYGIDKAGVWVDCVRERKPVIHNDYASLPHRKGMPEGHAHVIRELVVPVMQGDKVMAILGVGNKPDNYTSVDVAVVSELAGLAWQIAVRKRAEEEVHRLNAVLEVRVRERTAALEVANKELEAFSYSVSHDLRAPLRSIDGFSRIVLEDYAAKLDEEGRDSLQRIRAAAQRMGQLIDDMLTLSRVGRSELRWDTVDLAEIAHEVAANLRQREPARHVDIVVAGNLKAEGDARLLRIALENLLGNAWKFTGKCAAPRIEVGIAPTPPGSIPNAQPVFFVRDNGAGFDPAYAGKLFGAFQRLHTHAEFPGTGVGLATVQRVIHRHGGRIWGEGQVGAGATFFFTVGENTSAKTP